MGATTELIKFDCFANSGTIGSNPGFSWRPSIVTGWLLDDESLNGPFCSQSVFSLLVAFSLYKRKCSQYQNLCHSHYHHHHHQSIPCWFMITITTTVSYTLSQLNYWRVGAVKVATEEGSNLLSSKEVTMATEPQPTSRHLSTQH